MISGPKFDTSLARGIYPYLLLLIIVIPSLTLRLDLFPQLWFDEGYKLNAANTLAKRNVYGTYTVNGYNLFDPGISSGPADIISVALSFKLVGVGIIQARFVIVLFALLGIFCLYGVTVYTYGKSPGLFIIIFLLMVPTIEDVSYVLLGRQVLGEIPALTLIAFGVWLWFKSWENGRILFAALAGVFLGLGLLSKTQVAIALFPALFIVALGRTVIDRSRLINIAVLIIFVLGIVGGWQLLGRFLSTDEMRHANQVLLWDAIRSNLVTNLYGRTLPTSSWVIFFIMFFGALLNFWLLRAFLFQPRRVSNQQWAEILLILFVLFSSIWFAFFSVGWPRYAFVGLIVALILVGKLIWHIFTWVFGLLYQIWPSLGRWFYSVTIFTFTGIALITNIYPILNYNQDNQVQQMADYIRTNIPRDAVIESWEWELDAISSHWEYHHPDQKYLFLAIRQNSHERRPFALEYDLMQTDPNYLIIGPFARWTQIYLNTEQLAQAELIVSIGQYDLYKITNQVVHK